MFLGHLQQPGKQQLPSLELASCVNYYLFKHLTAPSSAGATAWPGCLSPRWCQGVTQVVPGHPGQGQAVALHRREGLPCLLL